MECDRLREVLFDHVDGLLGREEAEAARDHLAACALCRALQEEVRRNFSALDAWEEEELPAGALARLEARIAGAPAGAPVSVPAPAPRRSWVRLAVPYAAGLASAAAVVWVFVVPHGSPDPVPRTPPVVAREALEVDAPAPATRFTGEAPPVSGPGSTPSSSATPTGGSCASSTSRPAWIPARSSSWTRRRGSSRTTRG